MKGGHRASGAATGLWVNANVNWRSVPTEGSTEPPRGRGCDEGCNAYVAAELWVVDDDDDDDGGGGGNDKDERASSSSSSSSAAVVPGYAKENSDVLLNVDGLELPLTWGGGARGLAEDLALLAGKTLQVRFYSREADVYAFGVRVSSA